jgi:hypothetical protein
VELLTALELLNWGRQIHQLWKHFDPVLFRKKKTKYFRKNTIHNYRYFFLLFTRYFTKRYLEVKLIFLFLLKQFSPSFLRFLQTFNCKVLFFLKRLTCLGSPPHKVYPVNKALLHSTCQLFLNFYLLSNNLYKIATVYCLE